MAIVIFAAPIFIFLISLASPHAISGQEIAGLQAEDFAVDSLTKTELTNRLSNIWQLGMEPSADWEGRIENGTYRLCNVTKSKTASFTNRLRYYANPSDASPQRLSDSKVTVKVRVEPPYEMHSGAGIRYRSPKADGDYYAFVLNGGNNVSLLRRIGRELRYLWSGETSTSSERKFTTLKIIGHGAELQLYVNDKLVHTEHNADLLEGDPGIMAYSIGCFVFDDFVIYHWTSEGGPS